jgi:hypothetical protein
MDDRTMASEAGIYHIRVKGQAVSRVTERTSRR